MSSYQENAICLLTDFGPKGEYYVASMKGVILKHNPSVKLIDISHNVSSYSVIEASYLLKNTYKYFPKGSVFVVVVDPGVGSSRKILAIRTKQDYFFIGPDNGIFPNAIELSEISECVSIENGNYFEKPVSSTFHGRDIMAPVAAYLTKGIQLNTLGPKINLNTIAKVPIPFEIILEKKEIKCSIQFIDSFGNGTTNVSVINNEIVGSKWSLKENEVLELKFNNKSFNGKFTSHFAQASLKEFIFLIGSGGYLEISLNKDNAAKAIGFKVGDIISIHL